MHSRIFTLASSALALLFLSGPLRAQAPAADSDSATLQPGDSLRIAVWRNTELSGEFGVGEDSALKHPLYQSVKVVGLPMDSVRERLRTYLAQFATDPQFVIEPLFRVAIGGQVRSPSLYALPRGTTLPQAVSLAGGPTTDGRLDRVRLIRSGAQRDFDLTDPHTASANIPIRSGDVILVAQRRHILRDVAGPLASITGAVISIIAFITR